MADLRNGVRYYGCWAGNPRGQKEDPKRCIESVYPKDARGMIPGQCSFKRGHGPEGLYCKIHDPVRVAEKAAAAEVKYQAESAVSIRRMKLGRRGPKMLEALVEISKGCNDARGLARKTLGELGYDPETGAETGGKDDE